MYIKDTPKYIFKRKSEKLALLGQFILLVVTIYFLAVIITLLAVVLGGIDVADRSVWSEHIRSVAIIIK